MQEKQKTALMENQHINWGRCKMSHNDSALEFMQSPLMMTLMVHLTLKIVRLAIHEDVVDEYNAEDAGPQVQVTE